MSLLTKTGLRRTLIALGAFSALSTMAAAPASADRGHRGGGRYYRSGPRVGVFIGIPPIVLVAGHPAPYYSPYDDRYGDGGGYEQGYDDGYDDRAREEWRRRHDRAHRHHRHHDCDHGYYY